MNEADQPTHFLIYDDTCPMCTFQMKVLTWMDWFNVTKLAGINDESAKDISGQFEREQLLEAIHCVAKDGNVYRGARAIRFLGLRMPLLLPLSLIMWIPGVIYIAEWFYKIIARNRYRISGLFGCKDACAIVPARKREGEKVALQQTDQSEI
jgi:predicted DCC family thiol-disulfide oxidoreductase YuxK